MINPDLLFTTQTATPAPKVIVYFGNKAIHEITGPVPLVDISQNINYTEAGLVDSITHQINLTGKVFKKPSTTPDINGQPQPSGGLTSVVNSIKELERLFVNCSNGTFGISCDNSMIYLATGIRVTSFNADKTPDNWTQSADYSVSMEYKTGQNPSDPDDQVENKSDSWTIEPLDDLVYAKFIGNVDQRGEWSNPLMKPRVPSVGNPVPAASVGGGVFGENTLQVLSIPQFRISRRLSAKGLPIPPSGTASPSGLLCPGSGSAPVASYSYLNAKRWVEKRLGTAFSGGKTINASGQLIDTGSPFIMDLLSGGSTNFANEFIKNKTWVYNHTRSINIDVFGGTYETNDSWVAMPTGMPYTEQYTIETSTNEQFTKTVRVAGSIQGLSLSPFGVMNGSTGVFPTGSGRNISLEFSLLEGASVSNLGYELPDVPSVPSHNNGITSSKYPNALSGWLKDIKPYLYRRASLAINSPDRTLIYTNPALLGSSPPNNPIYSKETLLSTIPVSTTEGHDPRKGTISYSYEYNNRLNVISGVISENITINNDAPSDIVAETNVIGRARGPILQKTGTTSTRKTVSIEVVVVPPTTIQSCFINDSGCPLFTGGFVYQTINRLVEGIKPFGIEIGAEGAYSDLFGADFIARKNRQGIVFKQSDSDSWNPTGGRYSRNVSWIYQQCSEDKYYLDH